MMHGLQRTYWNHIHKRSSLMSRFKETVQIKLFFIKQFGSSVMKYAINSTDI